jgi:hypothetical protein
VSASSPAKQQPTPGRQDATTRLRADILRARVERHLQAQGFTVRNGRLIAPVPESKEYIRSLHTAAVRSLQDRAEPALRRLEGRFLQRLLRGSELNPHNIDPMLIPIEGSKNENSRLWRWTALHWSIPVSTGYGRRLRFLVIDRGHRDAVIGLIGLADPVFGLGARDKWIGWTRQQRQARLACVMDAFALGAVPPYSDLCGGKLVALLATSREVHHAFRERYAHRTTLIAGRDPEADLALITTISALGRSSIYNRLTGPDRSCAFHCVGFTQGTGDFHLGGDLYHELAAHAAEIIADGTTYRHENWPRGTFRNRREVIQRALDDIGLNSRALRIHGIRRPIYCAPLASNTREWLRGDCTQLNVTAQPASELAAWWRSRWGIPRSSRVTTWRAFNPATWRLW